MRCFIIYPLILQVGIVVLSIICHIWKIVPDLNEAIEKIKLSQSKQDQTAEIYSSSSATTIQQSSVQELARNDSFKKYLEYLNSQTFGQDQPLTIDMYNYCLELVLRLQLESVNMGSTLPPFFNKSASYQHMPSQQQNVSKVT